MAEETQALVPRRPGRRFSFDDLEKQAKYVAKSGLFPNVNTPEKAITLMGICEAEGLNPMAALTRYHIIEGKPSKQSHAMLSDFQRAGGKFKWLERTSEIASARFWAPGSEDHIDVTWTMEDAQRAGLAGKKNWKQYPRQMLTARVISEGVNASYPAARDGLYTPEEVMDFDDTPAPKMIEATPVAEPQEEENPFGPSDLETIAAKDAKPEPPPSKVPCVPFGKNAGTPVSDLSAAQLDWYINRAEENLQSDDYAPTGDKSRFAASERAWLLALATEQGSR